MRKVAFGLSVLIVGVLLGVAGCRGQASDQMPIAPGAQWDLVVFGDSSAWGVADTFGARIEEDLGVVVTAHDFTAGGEPIANVLRDIRDREPVRKAVAEAEVITFIGNPTRSVPPEQRDAVDHCADPSILSEPANAAPEMFDAYEADIVAVIDEILELRRGKPTIIRGMDYYMPLIAPWREAGVYDGCWQLWEYLNQAIYRACAARSIPVARVHDAFNGQDHHEDPREKGYIVSDGMHTTWEGRDVIGEAFRALGYAPVKQ